MFQADPRGILALVALAMCWALVVFFLAPLQRFADAETLERELQARNEVRGS